MENLINEMTSFKSELEHQRELTMNRIDRINSGGLINYESREFINRLMSHAKHLNNTISLVEYSIKDIDRKLEKE